LQWHWQPRSGGDVDVDRGRARRNGRFFRGDYSPGTIVVKTNGAPALSGLVQEHAVRYPSASARPASQWAASPRSTASIATACRHGGVERDKPTIPDVIPRLARNPHGRRAMTLAGGEYAIHGTNMPVQSAASCPMLHRDFE